MSKSKKGEAPVLTYKKQEYEGERGTIQIIRYRVEGREIEVIERKPGEWHLLIWNNEVLEDKLSYHRDPAELLGIVGDLLGKGTIHRGAKALELITTFGAVVHDAMAMQQGIK